MPPAGCPTDQACYSQPQQLSSVQAAESADVPVFQQHQLPSELSAAKRDCTGRAVIKLWVSIDISGVSKSSFQDKVSTCSAKARAQEKKKKKKKTYYIFSKCNVSSSKLTVNFAIGTSSCTFQIHTWHHSAVCVVKSRDRTKAQVLKMKHGTEMQEALPLGDLFKQTQQDPKTSKQSTTHWSLLWLNIDTKIHGLTLPTQSLRKELGCLRWACW